MRRRRSFPYPCRRARAPDVSVRNNHPVGRPSLDDFGNLFHDLSRARMSGIEHAAGCRELSLGNRRMPRLRRAQGSFSSMWKPILEDVHVNSRVIEQLRRTMVSAAEEVQLRLGTRCELLSMLVRFPPSESSSKVRTQGRLRLGWCRVETAANRCNRRRRRYWPERPRLDRYRKQCLYDSWPWPQGLVAFFRERPESFRLQEVPPVRRWS